MGLRVGRPSGVPGGHGEMGIKQEHVVRAAAELNSRSTHISGTCVPMTQLHDSVHPRLCQKERKHRARQLRGAPGFTSPRCHTAEGSTTPEEAGCCRDGKMLAPWRHRSCPDKVSSHLCP